jgi:hypothetical protein
LDPKIATELKEASAEEYARVQRRLGGGDAS